MRSALSKAVTLSIGILVLAGYFVPVQPLLGIRTVLLDWAVIILGAASLVGVINLLRVHARKVQQEDAGWVNSIFMLTAFVVVVGFGLWVGPGNMTYTRGVNGIMIPIESSLLALLAVTLATAIIRAFKPTISYTSIVFILSGLFFLWAGTGFIPFQETPAVQQVLTVFNTLPIGGARGLLLGIALGSLTTGIRALTGLDKPYTE
jgi:hypothetical protein